MAAPSFEAHHLISGLAKPALAAFWDGMRPIT